ncbi:hypothetical protein FRC03_006583 [Tulasnella sp. 419]|nr:hypothetical protein FRC02_001496 [Tulasnella sp. 418]KAG8960386.1 hypothetical protein FRC03_006583 [Tulasnella sp. 419]
MRKSSTPHTVAMASQSNNHLTATVAYNGIHVIDLTTSHPVSSYTVGPQTHFTCPSVSRVESHPSGSQTRNTYAVIEEAPDMPSEQEGRTIWVWSDPLERGAVEAALGQKQAFQVIDASTRSNPF